MKEIFDRLAEPFPAKDIQWLPQHKPKQGRNGKPYMIVNAFLRNRAIMERLDAVVGAENWQNVYVEGPDGGVLCGIGIRVGEHDWVWKYDGATNTDKGGVDHKSDIAVKGGLSNAMKRAAVQWGIGRYLYSLGKTYAEFGSGPNNVQFDGQWLKWDAPKMPQQFLPDGDDSKSEPGQEETEVGQSTEAGEDDPGARMKSLTDGFTDRQKETLRRLWSEQDAASAVRAAEVASKLETTQRNNLLLAIDHYLAEGGNGGDFEALMEKDWNE